MAFEIIVKNKKYEASEPKVKNLKDFLRFQKALEEGGGFDDRSLSELLSAIKGAVDIKDGDIATMSLETLAQAAQDMADWIAESLRDTLKNL